jgi:hypothetical protein
MNTPVAVGLLGSLLLSQADPQGTREMSLAVGETRKVAAPPSAEVVCDDPVVVEGQRTQGMARFSGLRVGSTLCAVRAVSGAPYAAYRIVVTTPAR